MFTATSAAFLSSVIVFCAFPTLAAYSDSPPFLPRPPVADENTCRKSFVPTEAVAVGAAIERAYKPVAVEKKVKGQKAGGGDKRSVTAKRSRANCPKAKPQDETARTTAVAAPPPLAPLLSAPPLP